MNFNCDGVMCYIIIKGIVNYWFNWFEKVKFVIYEEGGYVEYVEKVVGIKVCVCSVKFKEYFVQV